MKRTSQQIKNIKKACVVADLGFKYILKKIKPGISEKELAKLLSVFLKEHSDGLAFKPIVAFGKNTSIVHHHPTERKLKSKDIILFDFGARINDICSDLSRTIFLKKANEKQKKAYNAVLEAQGKAIEHIKLFIKNNKKCKAVSVDKTAREYLISKGFPTIPHGLGHGLGKKVHSGLRISPKSKSNLNERMVFTIEPGVYLKNFGIRIEDDVLIKNGKVIILTKSTKKLLEL